MLGQQGGQYQQQGGYGRFHNFYYSSFIHTFDITKSYART